MAPFFYIKINELAGSRKNAPSVGAGAPWQDVTQVVSSLP